MNLPAWVDVHLIPGVETRFGLSRSGLLKCIKGSMKSAGVEKGNTQHCFRYNGPGKCSDAGNKEAGMNEWERQSESLPLSQVRVVHSDREPVQHLPYIV